MPPIRWYYVRESWVVLIRGDDMGAKNPWLPETAPLLEGVAAEVVAQTGATDPQPAVTPPEAAEQLRRFTTAAHSRVWVVGAHGGSAETTVAQLLAGTETGHRWPDTTPAPAVLLTARTHANGLKAAQLAMRAWRVYGPRGL